MLEKLATVCLLFLLVTFSAPLAELFDAPRGETYGLFDLLEIEARQRHLERIRAAHHQFWEIRDVVLDRVQEGKVDLRTAAEEFYAEAESLRPLYHYDEVWPTQRSSKAVAEYLVSALRIMIRRGIVAPTYQARLDELEDELCLIPEQTADR